MPKVPPFARLLFKSFIARGLPLGASEEYALLPLPEHDPAR